MSIYILDFIRLILICFTTAILYICFQRIDFEKAFKKDSTTQIKLLIFLVSLAIGITVGGFVSGLLSEIYNLIF